MYLILNNYPQSNTLTYEDENILLFKDQFFQIFANIQDQKQIQISNTNGYICLIFDSISIINENKNNLINKAEYFLEEYLNNPEDFLLNTSGSYLLVIYKSGDHSLRVYRDLIGMKHAYYSQTNEGLCLSTSILPVLSYRKKGNNHIDPKSLNLYLTFQYLPQPYTIFSNIFQVPLNKSLIYQNGKLILTPLSSSFILMIKRHKVKSDISLEEILINSFKRQLSDKNFKVGAFLSGGMDTSSNIAVLASDLGIKPDVYTAGFKEQEYDETPFAKIMADKYNLNHTILTITPEVMNDLSNICALFDNPIADRAIIPEYLICQQAEAKGITHMISGEVGDEVLGYPRNLPEDISSSQMINDENKPLAEYYYSISALMQDDMRNDLLSFKNNNFQHNYLFDLYQTLSDYHPFEKIYYGQWQTWMIDNVLMKDTQLFNHFSLKFVSPYMDVQLMKHIIQISANKKMELLQNKKYLKNALVRILPEAIINKKKHKFHVPIAEWLMTDLYEQTHDMLLASDSLVSRFMNKDLVRTMLEDHKLKKADYNRPLWGLFFLENWYKMKKAYL